MELFCEYRIAPKLFGMTKYPFAAACKGVGCLQVAGKQQEQRAALFHADSIDLLKILSAPPDH